MTTLKARNIACSRTMTKAVPGSCGCAGPPGSAGLKQDTKSLKKAQEEADMKGEERTFCAPSRWKAAPDENIRGEIGELAGKYHDARCALLPALHLFQREYGWLSAETLRKIGETLNVPGASVKSVATFYSMFRHRLIGRHLIQLCTHVSCMIMGGETLLHALKERYDLEANATTPDGRFSLVIMECIGACDMAPAMLVDTNLHGNLTKEGLLEVLERYE